MTTSNPQVLSSKSNYSSKYWFARSEECMTKADAMVTESCRRSFRVIAEQYYALGVSAEQREQ